MVIMGRRSYSQPLAIWVNGELVGHWTPASRRPMEFRYTDNWLGSPSARPLSLPLPLVGNEPVREHRVEHHFDNLLLDSGAIRKRLAQRNCAGSGDAFDLLAAIGRDCVGSSRHQIESTGAAAGRIAVCQTVQ